MSSNSSYKKRLNSLPEPERSIAKREFFAILSVYDIDKNLMHKDAVATQGREQEYLIRSADFEIKSGLPKDFGGISMLDRIAEVAVWAATGVIDRITKD